MESGVVRWRWGSRHFERVLYRRWWVALAVHSRRPSVTHLVFVAVSQSAVSRILQSDNVDGWYATFYIAHWWYAFGIDSRSRSRLHVQFLSFGHVVTKQTLIQLLTIHWLSAFEIAERGPQLSYSWLRSNKTEPAHWCQYKSISFFCPCVDNGLAQGISLNPDCTAKGLHLL